MSRSVLLVVLALLFILCEALLFLPNYDSPGIVKFLIISQVMFAISIGIFLIGRKIDFKSGNKHLIVIVVMLAIAARLVMLVGADDKHYLSDDIFRYIWDGRITANGINPYLYSPQDTEIAHLVDDTIHPRINHPQLPTIYPPMAQNIFLLSYILFGDNVYGFKIIAALFELLTIALLFIWFRSERMPRANLLLWLFSPLILIEFYLSAHLDILGMPFLVGALISISHKKATLSGILLAMATLVKFYGLFFFPFIFLHFLGRDRLRYSLGYIGTIILLYLPYSIGINLAVFGSLFKYLSDWQFNASIFFLLKYGLGFAFARIIVAIAFIGWLVWLMIRKKNVIDQMFASFGGYLVLTTTFFPWYFVWLYPFVLRNLSVAFLFLSGSVLLSYHVLIGQFAVGKWVAIPWLGILSYLPFFILLIAGSRRKHNLENFDG